MIRLSRAVMLNCITIWISRWMMLILAIMQAPADRRWTITAKYVTSTCIMRHSVVGMVASRRIFLVVLLIVVILLVIVLLRWLVLIVLVLIFVGLALIHAD
jgi:hypothetical protein